MRHVMLAGLALLALASMNCWPCSGPLPDADSKRLSASDFEILYWTAERNEHGTTWLTGEIRNNGNVAAGVELQAIVRDAGGRILDSREFWPASVSNIPAGSTWPIKSPITDKPGGGRVELRVIRTEVWD